MDSPSRHTDTLNSIVHFLHTNGLYAAEEALLRELENRYPDTEGSSPTGSAAAQPYLPGCFGANNVTFSFASQRIESHGQAKASTESDKEAR
jgi:hypothetical protein